MINRRRQGGFTLIEVMVVILLIAMIVSVLVTGLSRVFQLRVRLLPYLDGVEEVSLVTDWVRHTMDGVVPDYDDGNFVFKGNEQGFTALSLRPLDQRVGAPMPITWAIIGDDAERTLRYTGADGKTIDVAHWTGKVGSFSYFDGKDREWRRDWPPPLQDTKGPQMPAMIRLQGRLGNQDWLVVATPRGPTVPLQRVTDFLKMFQ